MNLFKLPYIKRTDAALSSTNPAAIDYSAKPECVRVSVGYRRTRTSTKGQYEKKRVRV